MGCGLNKDGLVSSLPRLYPTHCMLVTSNKNKYQISTSPLVVEEQHRADSWRAWETVVSMGRVCVCVCVFLPRGNFGSSSEISFNQIFLPCSSQSLDLNSGFTAY